VTPTARSLALAVLRKISVEQAYAAPALRSAMESGVALGSADRGLLTELVYGTLRRRGDLDYALSKASGRRLKDLPPKLHDVLRLGAYQLLFLDRIPAHAAVDEMVSLARVRAGEAGARQTNAILRSLDRMKPEERTRPIPPIESQPVAHVAVRGNLPQTVAEVLVAAHGAEGASDAAASGLLEAPAVLRANALVTTQELLVQEVQGKVGHCPASVILPQGISRLPQSLSAVQEGRATVQGESSMQVTELLGPQPGERILDVCAAPGGKTTHIAECMGDEGEILAHDVNPSRLRQVEAHIERLRLKSVRCIDTLPHAPDAFDRILIDAPCTGLGTLRQHPEIKWRFRPEQLGELANVQANLIQSTVPLVRKDGIIVYSVCTVSVEETTAQLSVFGPDFECVDQRLIRLGERGMDGFFMAKMIRTR
jgi:16S rRNA (cytosine967-C5)-methyltransferase